MKRRVFVALVMMADAYNRAENGPYQMCINSRMNVKDRNYDAEITYIVTSKESCLLSND